MLLGVMNQKYYAPVFSLDITSSTMNGLNLYDYFKSITRREPIAGEQIIFTVKPGVSIIGKTSEEPAIISGTGWATGNVLKIVNFGSIIGRGGTGGRGAVRIGKTTHRATDGEDGGTAVHSTVPLTIDNYSIVYGGGGGGGGTGTTSRDKYESNNSGNGGGGAPYGKGIPNLNSMDGIPYVPGGTQAMADKLEQLRVTALPSAPYSTQRQPSRISMYPDGKNWQLWYLVRNPYQHSEYYNDSFDLAEFDSLYYAGGNYGFLLYPIPKDKNPQYLYDGMLSYQTVVTQAQIDDPTYYFTDVWNAGNSPIWVPGMACRHAGDGTATTGGHGGFGYNTMYTSQARYITNVLFRNRSYLTECSAAKGGNIGTDGADSPFLKTVGIFDIDGDKVEGIFNTSELQQTIYPGSNGGKAGYVSTGSVTITNINSGVTKGR